MMITAGTVVRSVLTGCTVGFAWHTRAVVVIWKEMEQMIIKHDCTVGQNYADCIDLFICEMIDPCAVQCNPESKKNVLSLLTSPP